MLVRQHFKLDFASVLQVLQEPGVAKSSSCGVDATAGEETHTHRLDSHYHTIQRCIQHGLIYMYYTVARPDMGVYTCVYDTESTL